MATVTLRHTKDNWYALLDGAINAAVTECVIDGAGVGAEPSVPFYLDIGTEQIECTAVAADTPSAGHSTLTIVRARNGTTSPRFLRRSIGSSRRWMAPRAMRWGG